MTSPVSIIILACVLANIGHGQNNIFRDNYGVNFRDEGILEFVHESWHHTFAINITFPTIPDFPLPCRLDRDPEQMKLLFKTSTARIIGGLRCIENNTCTSMLDMICPTVIESRERHKFIEKKIEELHEELNLLIPDSDSPRRSRGLLNIVGEISKSLFGTATVGDQIVLAQHIEEIEGSTAEIKGRVNTLEDKLGSYFEVQSRHDDLIEEALEINSQYVNQTELALSQEINDIRINIAEAINFIHLSELHYTTTLKDIYEEIKEQLQGVEVLMRGYLPKQLVKVTELRKTIKHVNKELQNRNMRLSHYNHVYYYHINDVDYKREGNILYIKIKLPITANEALFRVYFAQVIPMPMSPDSNQFSMIQLDHNYLAINDHDSYYALLTYQEYQFCLGHRYRRCDSLFKIYKTNEPTCLLALFLGDTKLVKAYCHTIITGQPQDYIMSLSAGEYYMSTSDNVWNQTCIHEPPKRLNACKHCIITVPCGCSIQGKHVKIPHRFENCLNSTTPYVLHAVNIPTLLAFYGESKDVLAIAPTKRFAQPVKVNIPAIKIIGDKFSDVVGKIKAEDISLKKVAKQIQDGKKIYATPSAKLRSDLGILANTNTQSSLFGISGISLLVSFLALFLAIRNARVVMLASAAQGLVIHDVESSTTEKPTPNFVIAPDVIIHSVFSAIMVLLALGCMAVGIIYMKRILEACFTKQPSNLPFHSTVSIVFYSCGRYAIGELFTFPGDVNKIKICQREEAKLPTIRTGCGITITAQFDWTFLDVRREDGRRICLPREVTFSTLKTRNLKEILLNPDEIKVMASYNSCYFDLFTWKKPEHIQRHLTAIVNPTFRMDEEAMEKITPPTAVV